jgi:hypothetical protein
VPDQDQDQVQDRDRERDRQGEGEGGGEGEEEGEGKREGEGENRKRKKQRKRRRKGQRKQHEVLFLDAPGVPQNSLLGAPGLILKPLGINFSYPGSPRVRKVRALNH